MAVVAASLFHIGAASASVGDNKLFVVSIDGITVGPAPDTWAGDADAQLRVTITNQSRQQQLGSANVTVPEPFHLVGSQLIELRNLGLAPGQSFSIDVSVDVQTCVATTPEPFQVTAKQSNDYNGAGNDLFLDFDTSDLMVDVTGTCGLGFIRQPADAERGTAITAVPFGVLGPDLIGVEVLDAGGQERATHFSGDVTLVPSNPATQSITVTANIASVDPDSATPGVATFSPGPTLSPSAFDYRFSATASGLTPSQSQPFDIVDDQVNCEANKGCNGKATATQNGQTVTAEFGTGSANTNLLVSIGAADVPAFECPGYPRQDGWLVSQFVFTGDLGGDRNGTMSTTVTGASRPLKSYEVCWAAPYPFLTEAGTNASVQGTKPGTAEPLFVGLLPDCAKRGEPARPCVSSRSFDRRASTVTVIVEATGEDPWRY